MERQLEVPSGAVVVGTDGSSSSRRAVDWAAKEASRRGSVLHIVAAAEQPRGGVGLSSADLTAPFDRTVTGALEQVRESHPSVTVSGAVVPGKPEVVLVEASQRATVVVVGARGLGRFTGVLLGSVSQKVAALAHGPVIVIREEVRDDLSGPVIIGADPTDPPVEALRYALDDANRRGVDAVVVTAGEFVRAPYPYLPIGTDIVARQAEEDYDDLRQTVEKMASEAGVNVEVRRLVAHPVEAILSTAGTESLVVVGSRGHGGLASLVLGSVSRGVLHQAAAVAVVRVRAGLEPEAMG